MQIHNKVSLAGLHDKGLCYYQKHYYLTTWCGTRARAHTHTHTHKEPQLEVICVQLGHL